MIVPAYTFRPMTRSAMVLERLAAESGRTVAAILSHVGHCPYRRSLLRLCRSSLFGLWEHLDADGKLEPAPAAINQEHWQRFSAYLLENFGQHVACPNCEKPCQPADNDGLSVQVRQERDP